MLFRSHRKTMNTWSHPVVAGGRLYLRNQDEISCYDIRASGGESKAGGTKAAGGR